MLSNLARLGYCRCHWSLCLVTWSWFLLFSFLGITRTMFILY